MIHEVLGAHGGIEAAVARAYRWRAYAAGGATGIRQSAGVDLAAGMWVTVIAAHSGTKSGLFDPEYFHVFAELARRFPNLYGDTSVFNVPIRGRHVAACLQDPLTSRMVHGSDFPVSVNGHFAWLHGHVSWQDFRRCQNNPNILEQDYQLKRAMDFPPESFTRIGRLLRRS